jgi:hypothetical protein
MPATRGGLRAALARLSLLCAALLVLAGCATDTRMDAPETVRAARYVHDGPPALTLYTMISNRSNSGAHTSLMINASERVVFDPAGSVSFAQVPERADVLYGITPAIASAYASAHARSTYRVAVQRIEVPAQVAEMALRLAQQAGPVPQAYCTQSTSQLLAQLPGFESIRPTFFPVNLQTQFAALPGVRERVLREDDEDDKRIAIARLERALGMR